MRFARLPFGAGRAFAGTSTNVLTYGPGCIAYLEAYETTGSASAAVQFIDGISANGQYITDFLLTEGQSTSETFWLHQMPIDEGLFTNVTSGAVSGSATVWLDHVCAHEIARAEKLKELWGLWLESQMLAQLGAG
jgi:hypothetical protein